MSAGERLSRGAGSDLRTRYTAADLSALAADEARRFLRGGSGDPRVDMPLAWELLYRLEPELYDRLASAERLHPAVIQWLPAGLERIVEVGAGTGRLTLELSAAVTRLWRSSPRSRSASSSSASSAAWSVATACG